MKITIDTTEKTVRVHGNPPVLAVYDFLQKAGIDLNEYTLITETEYNYIPAPVLPSYPVYPIMPIYPVINPYQPDWTYKPGIVTPVL